MSCIRYTLPIELMKFWKYGSPYFAVIAKGDEVLDWREMAGRYLRRERPDHTLQPTALVHEAYLKLVQLDRQLLAAFSAPLSSAAFSSSTVTLPVKLVSTPLPAALIATSARLKPLPAILVRIGPAMLPAAALVSNALKRSGATTGKLLLVPVALPPLWVAVSVRQ